MPVTLACQDARTWPKDHPYRSLVLEIYGETVIAGPERYEDGNQHDHEELSDDAVRSVLGPLAEARSSVGVFIDTEPRVIEGVHVYSVSRLAAAVAARFPDLAARLGEQRGIVDALDSGQIETAESEYPLARLVGNIINVSRHPVGGTPALTILW